MSAAHSIRGRIEMREPLPWYVRLRWWLSDMLTNTWMSGATLDYPPAAAWSFEPMRLNVLSDGDQRQITQETVGRMRMVAYDMRANLERDHGPSEHWRPDGIAAYWGHILDALDRDADALAALMSPREG